VRIARHKITNLFVSPPRIRLDHGDGQHCSTEFFCIQQRPKSVSHQAANFSAGTPEIFFFLILWFNL
jgi:hypothetical protein